MDAKTSDILDFLLEEISKQEKHIYSKEIFELLLGKIKVNEVTPCIDKLVDDGYITKTLENLPNSHPITPGYYCRIKIQGLLFLERGGYKCQMRRALLNTICTIAKTIAIILNAIMILIIATFTAWVSWRMLEQDGSVKEATEITKKRIDDLKVPKEKAYIQIYGKK